MFAHEEPNEEFRQMHGIDEKEWEDYTTPWQRAEKPPIAVVGSGPAGLINAYLLSVEGYPVTVFEAFHDLGGVLRYGIPEFRLPNALIDNVVQHCGPSASRAYNSPLVERATATTSPEKFRAGMTEYWTASSCNQSLRNWRSMMLMASSCSRSDSSW